MENKFKNNKERIEELKLALETVLTIMNTEKDLETAYMKSRTLIQDVLSEFKEDRKFVTAKTVVENINGLKLEFIR